MTEQRQSMLESSSIRDNKCFNAKERPSLKVMLQEDWRRCIAAVAPLRFVGSNDAADQWFEHLWNLHTEESRHYHTAVHLEEMIHYLELLKEDRSIPFLSSPSTDTPQAEPTILLSIFFHDAIYDAKSSDNEEKSALLFLDFCKEAGLEEAIGEKVAAMIRATQTHTVQDTGDNPTELALFLDLDMAVLGKNDKAYAAYAGLIRKEYAFVPRAVYCEKRADILEAFLKQPYIYGTKVMRDIFERQARKNVQHEIDLLRRGEIPGEE